MAKFEEQQQVNTPLFDFAKTQNLYHFDIDQPDDDDIILKPKFVGDWDQDLFNYKPRPTDFNLQKEHTAMQIEEWLNLRYDISKFLTKMVPTEQDTPTLKKIADSVPMDPTEPVQSFITRQEPGQYIPYHMDVLTSSGIEATKVAERGYRVIVFLTDWKPGEFMIWGTTPIMKWKAGWILAWPALKYPHGTANASHHAGYRLRVSGLATDAMMDWLLDDTLINV